MANILFLCTGNSCRSQMAEGWAKQLGDGQFVIQSAGIESHGKNPRAIAVMQEVGIDISTQESTRLTNDMLDTADWVITVCGDADEHCPVLPAATQRIHWSLNDPAKASGDEAAISAVFRSSRDDIKSRVTKLFDELRAKQD